MPAIRSRHAGDAAVHYICAPVNFAMGRWTGRTHPPARRKGQGLGSATLALFFQKLRNLELFLVT